MIAGGHPVQPATQQRVLTIDRVGGHPAPWDPQPPGMVEHRPRQLWLGLEDHLLGHRRFGSTRRITRPALGQIQTPIQEGVPLRPNIGQEHPNLAVLGLARRARVLALDPDRLGALLQEARLVQHEDAVGVPERLGNQPDQLIPNCVRIPVGGVQ